VRSLRRKKDGIPGRPRDSRRSLHEQPGFRGDRWRCGGNRTKRRRVRFASLILSFSPLARGEVTHEGGSRRRRRILSTKAMRFRNPMKMGTKSASFRPWGVRQGRWKTPHTH
jgi:hypothetical protein